MSLTLYESLRHSSFLTSQILHKRFAVRKRYHSVPGSVKDHDPLPADPVCQLLELLRTLVMPARSECLQQESAAGKGVAVEPLAQLAGGEAVAVGGKRLDHVLEAVGLCQPLVGEDVVLGVGELYVERARDAASGQIVSGRRADVWGLQEVDAVA